MHSHVQQGGDFSSPPRWPSLVPRLWVISVLRHIRGSVFHGFRGNERIRRHLRERDYHPEKLRSRSQGAPVVARRKQI